MDASGSVIDPIEAVAARIEAIGAPLAEDDGVRRFNDLYLATTRAVAAQSAGNAFADAAFISRLDVVSPTSTSRRSTTLPRAVSRRAPGPRCSRPARRRASRRCSSRRHERPHQPRPRAGAHHDDQGVRLRAGPRHPQHRDYASVDGLLQRVQDEIKARFTTGIVRDIDRVGGTVDDILANWSIGNARDNAWTQAQILHAIAKNDFLRKQF